MSQMLMEGDVAILRTRNAMKCWCNSNYCRWTKSSSGLVEVLYHKTITSVRPAFSIENGKDTINPIPNPSVKIGC
ncbi:low choriolytic enzyme-like [Salvelinus alpinus]